MRAFFVEVATITLVTFVLAACDDATTPEEPPTPEETLTRKERLVSHYALHSVDGVQLLPESTLVIPALSEDSATIGRGHLELTDTTRFRWGILLAQLPPTCSGIG